MTTTPKGEGVEVKPLGTVQMVPLARVKPYGGNPRKIPPKAIKQCAESIRQFGWQQPLVVDEDMVLLAGHTRREAALSLGLKIAPSRHRRRAHPGAGPCVPHRGQPDTRLLDLGLPAADQPSSTASTRTSSAVLDLADWQVGSSSSSNPRQEESALDIGDEANAFLKSEYTLTVVFGSKDDAEQAGPLSSTSLACSMSVTPPDLLAGILPARDQRRPPGLEARPTGKFIGALKGVTADPVWIVWTSRQPGTNATATRSSPTAATGLRITPPATGPR